jgi:hypothetical protein
VGKKLKRCAGYETRYGWQDLRLQKYPELGSRLMANCDVPDLDLLPDKYGIKKIRFSAGMESCRAFGDMGAVVGGTRRFPCRSV